MASTERLPFTASRDWLPKVAAAAAVLAISTALCAGSASAGAPFSVRVTGPTDLEFAGAGQVYLTLQVTNRSDRILFFGGTVSRSPQPCEDPGEGGCLPVDAGSCDWYPQVYPGDTVDLACWGYSHPRSASDRLLVFRIGVEGRTGANVVIGRVVSEPIEVSVTPSAGWLGVSGADPVGVALRPGTVDVPLTIDTGRDLPSPSVAVDDVEAWALVRPSNAIAVPGQPPAETKTCVQSVGRLEGGASVTLDCPIELASDTRDLLVAIVARGIVDGVVLERRSPQLRLVPRDEGASLDLLGIRPLGDADLAPAKPGERVRLAVDFRNRGTVDLSIATRLDPGPLGSCSLYAPDPFPAGGLSFATCRVNVPPNETSACSLVVGVTMVGTAADGTVVTQNAETSIALANPGCPGARPAPNPGVTPPPTFTEAPEPTQGGGAPYALVLVLVAGVVGGIAAALRPVGTGR